jgi:predicted  nucleic acid-binding Zn-ribbon protein
LKEKISVLIHLQDCDNRIQAITNRKNKAPLKVQKLEDELKSANLKLQEDNNRSEAIKKDRRTLEQEIQDLENKIEKSNDKLSHIKSNKEYTAALKEIEDLKNLINLTEDKVIQYMEEIEAVEKTCLANNELQQEMKKDFEQKKEEVEIELAALDKDLKDLENKRTQFSQVVDPDLYKKYLFLKERKGGLAISPVIGGVCRTCNIGLPPQKYNELQKRDVLLTCPNCHRMLYWEEEEKAE